MIRKRDRIRINLTVDRELYELAQKWSYVSGIKVSRLFDLLMFKHVLRFKYESEEEWEKSLEYQMIQKETGSIELPIDGEFFESTEDLDITKDDLINAEIPKKRIIALLKKSDKVNPSDLANKSFSDEEIEKILTHKLRGDDYYKRWKEVGGKRKIPER